MPRVPYEVHRARRRAPSVTPTETEYDHDGTASLASYSTYSHVSSSSYRPAPSIHDDLRRRKLSSSSHSHNPALNGTFLNTPGSSRQSPTISWNDGNLAPVATKRPTRIRTEEELEAKNQRRADRRAERARLKQDGARDTKRRNRVGKRESILDRWVKWAVSLDGKGSRARGLAISLGAVLLYRMVMECLTHYLGVNRDIPANGGLPKALIPILRRILPLVPVEQPNWAAQGMAISLDIAILWTGVITWVKMEGKRKGRSWRTQLTGILAILLNPLISYPSGALASLNIHLGSCLWATILLQRSEDSLACLPVVLGCISRYGMAGICVGFYELLLGKFLWLGGSRGILLLVKITALSASTALILQLLEKDSSLTIMESVKRLARGFIEYMPSGMDFIADTTKLRLLGTVLSQLPTASIILYSAISTRPSRSDPAFTAENTFPLSPLLPLILLSSALPLYLLDGDSMPGMGFPILPVMSLVALKGDDGDESWQMGVVLSNLAIGRSLSLSTSGWASAVQVGAVFAWNYVIGYTPSSASTLLHRIAGYIAYTLPLLSLTYQIPLIRSQSTAISHSMPHFPSAVSSAVLWIAWIWALRRLVEEIWAIGGFAVREDIRASGPELRVTDVK